MPFHKLVHSSQLIVRRQRKETTNHEPRTTNRKSFGFTLIEVMIVIALIGILSSFAVYGYQSSQKKARDAQRKSDLQQVKKALESAKNDCLAGSYYRKAPSDIDTATAVSVISNLFNGGLLEKNFQDPQNDGSTQVYMMETQLSTTLNNACPVLTGASVGQMLVKGTKTYVLVAKLEIANDPDSQSSFNQCETIIADTNVTFAPTISQNMARPTSGGGYYFVCPD